MTTPIEMSLQKLDRKGLQEALDKVKKNSSGLEIRTRSEFQLIESEGKLSFLQDEGVAIRVELDYVDELMRFLENAKKVLTINEADNAVARRAMLAQINALRESGIVVPKNQETK